MKKGTYQLEHFIKDLHRIREQDQSEQEMLAEIAPLAQSVAMSKSWITPKQYEADEEQGFGSTILHVEADQSLFIVAVSWLPGRGTPPHDHGTWAVAVAVEGSEENTFWERVDDQTQAGFAELRKTNEQTLAEGEALLLPSGAIHSMENRNKYTSLSFHVYGRHLNHTGRSQFDPLSKSEQPFLVKTQ